MLSASGAWRGWRVAGLIALEKTLPWRRPATSATALLLLVLGVLIAAPDAVPGLTVPGDGAGMEGMGERTDAVR